MGKFVENPINQRFRKVYSELEKLKLIKGKSDIANFLGSYNHVINSILKGDRNVTVDQLYKLFHKYGIDANYLFGNSDTIFLAGHPSQPDLPSMPKSAQHYSGKQNISLVPYRATAGYAMASQEEGFFDELPKFSVPGYDGDLVAFEIEGDSMFPTITSGDIVITEKMERQETIKDNQVYVVVTDSVVAKRIQPIKDGNHISSLRLISDNDSVFKPYEVSPEEIQQIYKVKLRLTNHSIG